MTVWWWTLLFYIPVALFAETTTPVRPPARPQVVQDAAPVVRPRPRPGDLFIPPPPSDRVLPCGLLDCTRTGLLTHVSTQYQEQGCLNSVLNAACRFSPWRALGAQERVNEVVRMVHDINRQRGWNVDPNAMLCIYAREGSGLEPMMLNSASCENTITVTDTGLGQVTAQAAGDELCLNSFRSRVNHFQNYTCNIERRDYVQTADRGTPAEQSGYEYVDQTIFSPEAQIELSMRVFLTKTNGHGANPDASDFALYNGATSYGTDVYENCYKHLRGSNPYLALDRLETYQQTASQVETNRRRCNGSEQ